jgi:hypothetical protein
MKRLFKKMSPAQVTEAQILANEWLAQHLPATPWNLNTHIKGKNHGSS